MGERPSRPVVWVAVAIGILAVVAAGIAANIALLDATDSDGLGELTPVVATDVRPARVVTDPAPDPPVEPTPATTTRDDDHDGDGDRARDRDRDDENERFDDD